MNKWFANIGVSRKLALGFGAVLALTLVLAWNGWGSLGSVIQRSGWMTEIAHLNNTLTDLRIARLQYMLANADQTSTERLDKNLGIYLAQQTKLLGTFNNPANVVLLKEQAGYNEQYQVALNDMRKGYAQANASHLAIGKAAERLDTLTSSATSRVLQLPEYDEQRFEQLLAISSVKEQLKQAQYLLQAYVALPSVQNDQAVDAQLDAALATLEQHRGALDNINRDVAQQIHSLLGEYRAAVDALQTATVAIATARQQMTERQAEIVRISDALYQFQLERLEIEAAKHATA